MRRFFLLCCLVLCGGFICAQTYNVSGIVRDQDSGDALVGAHVAIVHQINKEELSSITNERGLFRIKNVVPGDYQITITYLGYAPVQQNLTVENSNVRLQVDSKATSTELDEVEVTEKIPLAVQKGDTTQYNANAYKTNPDANAEDLIKKMPGIIVQNGSVQAQGEDVKEVLVDGKPFFGNDPTAALRNLPAAVIQRIEVFDQKSEQAQFSGVEDGETTKTINIVTKPGMRIGQFGKVYGGYGYEDESEANRYRAGGNTNIFNGNQRISLIAQSNNINQQNFAAEDLLGVVGSSGRRGGRGGRGGGRGNGTNDFLINQQGGIAQTHALGLNYNDQWGEKVEVAASYFFNQTDTDLNQDIFQNFIDDRSDFTQTYQETTTSSSTNTNHRANLRLNYRIDDNNSILVRPRLTIQQNDGLEDTFGQNFRGDTPVSETNYDFASELEALNFSNTLLYRHRFAKRGRTFSVRVNTNYSNNTGESNLLTNDVNQFNNLNSDGWSLSSNIDYTEPLGEKGGLQFTYSASYREDDSDRETFNFDEVSNDYTDLNEPLSNIFKSDYLTHRMGGGYRSFDRARFFMVRVNYQWAELQNEQTFPFQDQFKRTFRNVLPFAMARFRFDKETNLRIFYRTSTSPPSITQLAEVVDNANPLQLSAGNPDLEQNYQHSLFLRYNSTSSEKATVFYALIGGTYTNNYVGNSTFIAAADTLILNSVVLPRGGQLTTPVNLDGNWSARTFITYGMPLRKLKTNLNLNISANFNRLPGLINGELNYSNNTTLGLGVVLSSNISEKVDFTIGSTSTFNDINNSLNTQLNTQYFQQNSEVALNLIFGSGIVLRSSLQNQLFSGFSDDLDQNFWLWSANIGKKLFKDQLGEITLSVFDLLGQNTSIQRNITETYIEDLRTQVLQRYIMLSFTYQFRNFGKMPKEESREERRRRWREGKF